MKLGSRGSSIICRRYKRPKKKPWCMSSIIIHRYVGVCLKSEAWTTLLNGCLKCTETHHPWRRRTDGWIACSMSVEIDAFANLTTSGVCHAELRYSGRYVFSHSGFRNTAQVVTTTLDITSSDSNWRAGFVSPSGPVGSMQAPTG